MINFDTGSNGSSEFQSKSNRYDRVNTGTSLRGAAVRWLPLIRLVVFLERQGFPFLGTPSQPFDQRELIWTSAVGKGAEAVAKRLATLNIRGVNKRFSRFLAAPDFATTVSSQTHFAASPRGIYQELAVLANASINNQNNIIRLLAIDKNYSFNYFSIVIEYAELGSLRDYLSSNSNIQEHEAKLICSQITAALGYLHSEDILHNDVKMENVLITRTGAKLADFGHAIFNFKTQTKDSLQREQRIGTERWAAPELCDSDDVEESPELSPKSDLYSLGFIIAFLALGFDCFIGIGDYTLIDLKRKDMILTKIPKTWASQILEKTLCLRPSERFDSANEIQELLSIVRYCFSRFVKCNNVETGSRGTHTRSFLSPKIVNPSPDLYETLRR